MRTMIGATLLEKSQKNFQSRNGILYIQFTNLPPIRLFVEFFYSLS